MVMEHQAEVFNLPTQSDEDVVRGKRIARGRGAVDRYIGRLESSAERLQKGPEASELYCALAEIHDGIVDTNPGLTASYYNKALEAFPLSRPANLGMRRIARGKRDLEATLKAIDRDMANASEARKINLKLERVRTLLYIGNKPDEAIQILEELDELNAEPPVDPDSSTESAEIIEKKCCFDPERFFLWEDALWATQQWERYEKRLRDGLSSLRHSGDLAEMLEIRMLHFYQYILPDMTQADILADHLCAKKPCPADLVRYQLKKAERTSERDKIIEVLTAALDENLSPYYEILYRTVLADIAFFSYEDHEHARTILKEGLDKYPNDLILLHKLQLFLEESGNKNGLLETLSFCINILESRNYKAHLLYTIGTIFQNDLELNEEALECYVQANAYCASYIPAVVKLNDIFIQNHQWEMLADLYENELKYAKSCKEGEFSEEYFINRRTTLASIYEDELEDYSMAFQHYQAILEIHPDHIWALKGAARMASKLKNWTELLQCYANAEAVTEDPDEHYYLLEHIAKIAEEQLDDPETACTALEALINADVPPNPSRASLARLYLKLKEFEKLIILTDEEIETSENNEYKASLLLNNGKIAYRELGDTDRALGYFKRACETMPLYFPAYDALERIYFEQNNWTELADLLRKEINALSDKRLICFKWRRLAQILKHKLNQPKDAIEALEKCLAISPDDISTRSELIQYYRETGNWNELIRILKLELDYGGTLEKTWLTHYWMGHVHEFRMGDDETALKDYETAFLMQPENPVLLNAWISTARRLGKTTEIADTLCKLSKQVEDKDAKCEMLLTLLEHELNVSHQPVNVLNYLNNIEQISPNRLIYTTILAMALAKEGRWTQRLMQSGKPTQSKHEQLHTLRAAIILNLPPELIKRAHDILCEITDNDLARSIWANLSPSQRPDISRMPDALIQSFTHEAQDLRRWATLSKLNSGDHSDPTEMLLTDERDESLSYRPDLELLAAYFEHFEKWPKLLQVLNVQEENTLNEQEKVQVTLQKAWVLSKINRPEDALDSVRNACKACSYENTLRLALYDYLTNEGDWNFLVEQIKGHIAHTTSDEDKASLWIRLASIYDEGLQNQEEALRCLDESYRLYPGDGSTLKEIANIAQKMGEIEISRRALDDYLQFHEPTVEEQLELAPKILDLHFNHPGGNTGAILQYFNALAQKSAQDPKSLKILAKAHAIAGNPQMAAEIILRLVHQDFIEEDVPLWMDLADLYIHRLNGPEKGEEILWKLFSEFPSNDEIFKALNAFYIEPKERCIFVENIKRVVQNSPKFTENPELTRKYLGMGAQIYGSELGLWKQAQDLYSEALANVSENSEQQNDLVKNRAYARCRVPGEAREAYREFCELLVEDPFQEDIIRAAIEICERNDAHDNARILRQFAQIFVPDAGIHLENVPVRPKVDISRPINTQALEKYLRDPRLAPVQELLNEALPLFEKVYKDQVPKRTMLGGTRVKSQEIQSIFSNAAEMLQAGSPHVYLGHDPSPVPLVFTSPDSIWLPTDLWETFKPEEQRHWAGYTAGLLWTGLCDLIYFDMKETWYILDAAYFLTYNKFIEKRYPYTLEAVDAIKSPWNRRDIHEIARIIEEITPEEVLPSKADSWKQAVLATADRSALLFSGSLPNSVPAVLASDGWDMLRTDPETLRQRLQQSPRLRSLLKFALSDDYLYLRFHAGLATRPVEINS